MAWQIEPQEYRVFQRNPLVAVIVDLRFHPILKVADRVADFQDSVRAAFPVFQEATNQVVSLQPFGPVAVKQEKLFQFWKVDGTATLTLTTSSLTLESRRHADRGTLFKEADAGIAALLGLYSSLTTTRLGLRYVNQIDQTQVQTDLGRPTTWQRLVSERFLAVPTGLADLDDPTLFACEVSSSLDRGALVARYGLLRDAADGRQSSVSTSTATSTCPSRRTRSNGLLTSFSDDIFSLFASALGSDLTFLDGRRTLMDERIMALAFAGSLVPTLPIVVSAPGFSVLLQLRPPRRRRRYRAESYR